MQKFEGMVIAEIADQIEIDLANWPTHCTQVCTAMLRRSLADGKLVNGQANFVREYGHAFHSWLELTDGRLADPTRYFYESTEPYIWVGDPSPEYEPQVSAPSQIDRLLGRRRSPA